MIPALSQVAATPLASNVDSGTIVLGVLALLASDRDAELVFTVEIQPQTASGGSEFPYAVASEPVAALREGDSAVSTAIRVSDRGFRTQPTDNPPNALFLPRLTRPYELDSELPMPRQGDVVGRRSLGILRIANPDGAFDTLAGLSVERRPVTIRVGGTFHVGQANEETLPWDRFETIFEGFVASVELDTDEVRVAVADAMEELENDLQSTTYAGSGGLQGGDRLKGRPKPLAFGKFRNVEPVLVDGANQIYQFHDGSMQAVLSLRDSGVALTPEGGVADIEAAPAPSLGAFITELDRGFVRLGAQPSGRITGDIEGDDEGGFVSEPRDIARRIATRLGGVADPGSLDTGSFASFPLRGVSGFFQGADRLSVLDALRRVMRQADGWIAFSRTGRLRIGPFLRPETRSARETLVETELAEAPAVRAGPAPVWELRLLYRPNQVVQDSDALAGSLTADERDEFSSVGLRVIRSLESVRTQHLHAVRADVATALDVELDAQTLANEMFQREKRRRMIVRLVQGRARFQIEPGDVVRTVSLRPGIGTQKWWVRRVVEDGTERTAQLELLGVPKPGTTA